MNHNDGIAFFCGCIFGVLITGLVLSACDATKHDGKVEIQNEAVSHGFGEWVVKTNSAGYQPSTKFEWNK